MTLEWLEADGLGGFASGTADTIRTRRYHGLLLVATTPPTGRQMLVNGYEAWVDTSGGRADLTAQRYHGDVVHPRGHERITRFTHEPWPTWTYALPDDNELVAELVVTPHMSRTILRWSLGRPASGLILHARPLLSGRDYHALHRENSAFNFTTEARGGLLRWHPYPPTPVICSATNATWRDEPLWYRNFLYTAERERGLDDTEDLASPGVLSWDLSRGPAVWVVGTEPDVSAMAGEPDVADAVEAAMQAERQRRGGFVDPLQRAADSYVVRRGAGKTIVAGYPWFTDWGRDTFIAMRGLCLATGRADEARDILIEWSTVISEGMLPNRFCDVGETPEYNAADASLWFVIVTHELLAWADQASKIAPAHGEAEQDDRCPWLSRAGRERLQHAMQTVLECYARGTRYGIRCDDDGLLACGEPGVQVTWMDARVDGREVTPRIGKPVEIQALWINALEAGAVCSVRWADVLSRARDSFETRFWNEDSGCLFDVVDVDHRAGVVDPTVRPNQILAVGGLPSAALDGERARQVVDVVERALLTPIALRTLAPGAPGYVGRYESGPSTRDRAYHQGIAWPWLMGPFIDAWVRVRGGSLGVRREARARFLAPLMAHLEQAGLGHVSEITDAEPPFTPRGCPFQAWSLGELIRAERMLR